LIFVSPDVSDLVTAFLIVLQVLLLGYAIRGLIYGPGPAWNPTWYTALYTAWYPILITLMHFGSFCLLLWEGTKLFVAFKQLIILTVFIFIYNNTF
jgi:hypothetical protein